MSGSDMTGRVNQETVEENLAIAEIIENRPSVLINFRRAVEEYQQAGYPYGNTVRGMEEWFEYQVARSGLWEAFSEDD